MRLVAVVCLLIFFWLFIKYLERRQVFYPTRRIEMTPKHAGLEYEDVYFQSGDGVRLNGWLTKADSSKGAIVFCHGNAGNISHRLESIIIFREMGLDVFIFDYRAYGRSGGWATEKGIYLDAMAAFDYLVTTRNIPPDRVVIFGRSLGGNVAIDLATKVSAACLVTESAFSSIEDMARAIYGVRPPRWLMSNHFDAASKIAKVEMPKLIVHSRDDELVPFRQGQKIFNSASEPKEFYELGGTHNESFLNIYSDYRETVRRFVEKHLP